MDMLCMFNLFVKNFMCYKFAIKKKKLPLTTIDLLEPVT